MKNLVRTVDLRFFRDDATGDYGLCHADTQNDYDASSFNAFWDGFGIFYDVFEHAHEHQNKYFRGEYAMNVGGEMAAMGAMWYYIDTLGVYNRDINPNSWRPMAEKMKHTTMDEVFEAIGGYPRYGYTLNSNVPKQRPTDNGELEYQIADFWKQVKEYSRFSEHEQEKQDGENYKNSVTFRKIADLHRYGYRMAERLVKVDCRDNANTLVEFIQYWNNFCSKNNAEEMFHAFKGITFKLYRDSEGLLSWTATLISKDRFSFQDVKLTANYKHFSIEDAWLPVEN